MHASIRQRFYSFDKSIIIGAGIGITPFAACLTDLEENFKAQGDPWKLTPTRSFYHRNRTLRRPTIITPVTSLTPVTSRMEVSSIDTLVDSSGEGKNDVEKARKEGLRKDKAGSRGIRRVDFHWSVREKNDLLWFSDLLNRVEALSD
jgi:predicted ferric reductase